MKIKTVHGATVEIIECIICRQYSTRGQLINLFEKTFVCRRCHNKRFD